MTHLYYQTLDYRTYLRYFFHRPKEKFLQAMRKDMQTENLFLTNAGRTGIFLSLQAAGLNRHDEVFVPRFMSSCVLAAVLKAGCPSLRFTENTKAVLLYHHWGYPQNFPEIRKILARRDVFVIEDCAHGLWGKSNGVRIGEFGDTALFSLPKIFEITYAGALRVNNKAYLEKIRQKLSYKPSFREYFESVKGEWVYVNFYRQPSEKRATMDSESYLNKWYSTLLIYPACKSVAGKVPSTYHQLREVFKKQNSNFVFFLENLKDRSFLLGADVVEEMAPLSYPFFSDKESILQRADSWLKQHGVYTGIYNFDINRNMFQPNFKKCVPIPIYASIERGLLEAFVKEFKDVS